MSNALRSNPRFGWRPWLAAIALAALLHLPLLWVQLQRAADPAEATSMVELLLTPPEPIPVSPPSEWADALELKWSLSGEPDPTIEAPLFEPLQGLDSGSLALSGQLTGLAQQAAPDRAESGQVPARQPPDPPQQPAEPPDAETQPTTRLADAEEPPEPARSPAVPALDTAIAAALAGTDVVRESRPLVELPASVPEPALEDDDVTRALSQTPAVRTPGALSDTAQAILAQALPQPPVEAPDPPTQRAPRPQPPGEPTTQTREQPKPAADNDRQYQPDGAAGAYSSDRNAFFSNLAEHLFNVNDAQLRAKPYSSRRIIDVRFSIDRQGRVMRVWTPAPRQSAATEAAKAIVWAASPVPQLAPDMPQAVLELTFPVIVGQ